MKSKPIKFDLSKDIQQSLLKKAKQIAYEKSVEIDRIAEDQVTCWYPKEFHDL